MKKSTNSDLGVTETRIRELQAEQLQTRVKLDTLYFDKQMAMDRGDYAAVDKIQRQVEEKHEEFSGLVMKENALKRR
jgi:cell division protein FtsB